MRAKARPSPAEIGRWLQWYNLEDYLFGTVSDRFQRAGTLSAHDFFAIVIWKSNRAKTRVRDGLAAIGKSVEQLMREVYEASTVDAKMKALLAMPGIGMPMASAVLAVCYPQQCTVLDRRVWAVLCEWEVEGLPARWPERADEYLQYCDACRRLAGEMGLSLRELDRALWGRSWESDLSRLVDGL